MPIFSVYYLIFLVWANEKWLDFGFIRLLWIAVFGLDLSRLLLNKSWEMHLAFSFFRP
jgi:hypothetical protein